MPKAKPIVTESAKFGVIEFFILATIIIGAIIKWKEFYDFFVPDGISLNWRFVILLIFFSVFSVWFIMNHFWKKEYEEHENAKIEIENLRDELKSSENKSLTDVITGIPNNSSLIKDIEEYFSLTIHNKQRQFIFIDLKDFRDFNTKFGHTKTNDLLRTIAQTIYKRMRRNEYMYRLYSGGDEFAFIIEGDQSDALGFSNRLVGQFDQLSKKTLEILGNHKKLSFHCSIVEMYQRDTFQDLFKRADDCIRIAEEGTKDFTICWHPNNIERTLSKKQDVYEKTRELFEDKTIVDKDYD